MRKIEFRNCFLMLAPGIVFLAVFLAFPLIITFLNTFSDSDEFSLNAYARLFSSAYFHQVFFRSIRLSLLSTALCAILGFPAAYYLSLYSKQKGVLMALAVFPLFTSPVIRSFSWMVILGKKGIVNQALTAMGLTDRPVGLLYNEGAMVVGFVQLFLPLMLLSLTGVLDTVPRDLCLAAGSLGAAGRGVFLHVLLPLSIPGLLTGCLLVFTGSMTAYATPQLLGGTDTRLLSTMIYQQAMSLGDWTQASAIAAVMTAVTFAVSRALHRAGRRLNSTI